MEQDTDLVGEEEKISSNQDLTAFDENPGALEPETDKIRVAGTGSFGLEEMDRFLLERDASVVAVLGDFGSGKTTISAAIYGFLKEASFGSVQFVESRTLTGLERRLHFSTLESGLEQADTERTSYQDDVQFLHLRLIDTQTSALRDIFISDRAGETYAQLRSGEIPAHSLAEISKAKILTILLDGERILDPRQRSNAYENVRQTLRVLSEEGAIQPNTKVLVVTTKMDLISGSDQEQKVLERLGAFQESVTKQFTAQIEAIEFVQITTRSQNGNSDDASTFRGMVTSWLNFERPKQQYVPPKLRAVSEFDRIVERFGL